MKKRGSEIIILLSLATLFSFHAFAGQGELISADHEKREIASLESEVLDRINNGGSRGDISRDVVSSDIDFDKAYRVYGNSDLFEKRTDSRTDIKKSLETGVYIWQVPIFVGNDTVLVDIFKRTEIAQDVPDDIKEELTKTLGQWKVGAIYVYDDRIVDFQNTVNTSLTTAGLRPEEYAYEFVSGLPGIRYPVAVVFDDQTAKFVIPAETASARAFEEGSETMEYSAFPSDAAGEHKSSQGAFPVYHFQSVAEASRNAEGIGLGGGIGISPRNTGNHNVLLLAVIGVLGIGFISTRVFLKKHVKRD